MAVVVAAGGARGRITIPTSSVNTLPTVRRRLPRTITTDFVAVGGHVYIHITAEITKTFIGPHAQADARRSLGRWLNISGPAAASFPSGFSEGIHNFVHGAFQVPLMHFTAKYERVNGQLVVALSGPHTQGSSLLISAAGHHYPVALVSPGSLDFAFDEWNRSGPIAAPTPVLRPTSGPAAP